MSNNVNETRKKPIPVTREEFEALRTLVHQLMAAVYPQQTEQRPREKFR